MKDLSIVIPTVNLSNISRSPSTPSPCSPSTIQRTPQFENDGCMLCVNGTPCCLQKRRATWTLKLRVALYCLSVLHPDKKYFNLKKDIYTYVDNHWDLLSINTAKSDRWRKQVQDSLSHCRHFESGWDAMGCNGHWRLIQPLNPWSFPPERENIMMLEDDEGVYTPDSSLSPRPSKSPREDPLYRNFPKRRSLIEEELENRKRKVVDADIQTVSAGMEEEGLLMLKYSPMIYAETPSPKCRTPRSNTSSTTSPSILGNSPMLASSGTYFTLSNFSNNLTLNSSGNNNPIYHPTASHPPSNLSVQSNITILDNSNPSSPRGSPLSSPTIPHSQSSTSGASATQHISPPIPSIPFSWKSNSNLSSSPVNVVTSNLYNKQVSGMSDNVRESSKANTLPNPFSGPPSPKYSTPSPNFFTANSNLKVPTELLQKSSPVILTTTNGQPTSPSSSPNNLSKLQQQNLILNCTY
ncbi:histidine kinase [Heterostelium album PN500]|uniref:Histidine kinase n=1 Tax=Heterostelium pallidum (strain ATCC 26659 / Pp 5 / PN500) TaxID=670386 RepID=D3BPA2_HETP5|nr:histidine kinase [Heterostelium album PN500]EFA77112.1 histidine kinase [Heterostelium album PN500]|eukprot:XP_020429241.1 histidine kinase [Heterostelium album PN500]